MEKKSSSQLVFSLQKWLCGESGKKFGISVIRSAQVVTNRPSHGYYWVWKRKDENRGCNGSELFDLLVAEIAPSSGTAKDLNNLCNIVYKATAVAGGLILIMSTNNIPEELYNACHDKSLVYSKMKQLLQKNAEVLLVIELTYVREIQTCLTGYSDCLGRKGPQGTIDLVCSHKINIQCRSVQIKEVPMI